MVDFIEEAGSTVYEWTSSIAKTLGTASSDLFNSAKDFFCDLFGLEDDNVIAYSGDIIAKLINSGMIDANATFYDSNGNQLSLDEIAIKANIKTGVSGGDEYETEFTIIKNNVVTDTIDGVESSISSLIEMTTIGVTNLASFIGNQIEQVFSPIFNLFFSNDDSTKDSSGQTSAERLMGSILADLLLGKDITEIAENYVNQTLITNILQDVTNDLIQKLPALSSNIATDLLIKNIATGSIIRFAITVAADHRMDSDEYGEAAITALASESLVQYFGGGADGMAAIAAMVSIYDSFKADSSMNGDQYENTATSAASAAASAYMGQTIGVALAAAFAEVPVVGPVVGYAIGYLIGALLYNPLKNNYDSKVDGVENIYDSIEDIVLQGDGAKENLEQMLKGIDDFIISSSGRFVRDFGIGVYNLFGADYGKKYSAGQYPNPYSFINTTPKEDGSGNIIVGLEREGVVIQAAEGQNDDLFGTDGQDSLVGKSGKNTIYGYGGNDHIEGRGDDDILVGGERFPDNKIINFETQSKILIANDNSKITLKFPQVKMMNHH